MQSNFKIPSGFARLAFVIALFVCVAASTARAAVIYEFSLPANGQVGAFSIQLTTNGFIPESGLIVIPLSDPQITSITGLPTANLSNSVIGIDVTANLTFFGVDLIGLNNGQILFTVGYPLDFFVFERTGTQTGSFSSTNGTVVSDLLLETANPVGTLTVTESGVPEPGSALLMGMGILGVAGWRRLRTAGN